MIHVLIVDDLEEGRHLLEALLEINGYRVTAAGDGLEALAAARRELPDVIVSDALMRRMDGFALCRAWMQDSSLKRIPFIFYSATYIQPEDEKLGLALGAARYLVKPLESEAFLGELRAVLQASAAGNAPGPASTLKETAFRTLHESVLSRKIGDKVAQLEAVSRKLRESEQNYKKLFLANPHPMWVYDIETFGFLAVNDAAIAHYGYSRDEFLSMTIADIRPAEELARLNAAAQAEGEGVTTSVWKHRTKDGTPIVVEITSHVLEFQGRHAKTVLAHDVTERMLAEESLRESEARFRGLVEQAIAGIYIIQDDKFAYVNPRFAEIFGYDFAEELIGRDPLSIVTEKDRGISAENIRQRIEGEMASVSYQFTGLRKDGSMIDVGVHGARATHGGRPAVIGLMQDISEKKRAEEQIQRYVAQLETAFMHTVEVATTLSEMRDPYTAGHERRVAEIAVAVGAKLGFDARRQEGLRVAGYLHDIGKITIPSEILSKPGKLTAVEFELIKGHSQASYDVLKNVEFPWPVAAMVLQHHERMDGSGYPRGLKGESILIEARILAVADVIEAMSSHRPYRPGLGIDKALAEIERGRGSVYDPMVADAFLKLFRETSYAIPA